MKKLIALSATLLIAAMPVANAQETGAGCGLGSVLLEGQSGKGANIAASFLNGLFSNTSSMTLGALGCDPTQVVEKDKATEIFVASNMDQLSSEAAQGGGDYLAVLSELMGISDEDRVAFQRVAQENYDSLFLTDGDAKQVIRSMEVAMLNDASLAKYLVN